MRRSASASASAPAPASASLIPSALVSSARSAVRARALSRPLHSAWAVASSGRRSCSPHASSPKSSAAELTWLGLGLGSGSGLGLGLGLGLGAAELTQRDEVLASKTARQLKSVAPSASAAPG